MATIVNNTTPQPVQDTSSSSNGLLTAVIILVLLVVLLYFGLPLVRRATTPTQVNVPGKIDVNVNTPNQNP